MDQNLYLDLLKKCLTAYLYPESSFVEIYPHPGLGPRAVARRAIVRLLRRRGYRLFKVQAFDPKARETGRDWPSIGYSMIGLRRLDNLQACVEGVLQEGVPGDLIEAGAWRGGACILMRAVLKVRKAPDRIVWVADSFRGLPAPSERPDWGYDLSRHPYVRASLAEVRANFERFGLLDEQVRFLEGWFKDSLPAAPIDRLSVLRLDCDLYESTMDALSTLYDKVSPRGFVIIDDYHSWAPCKLAVDEFRARFGIGDSIREIDGHGVFWRKSA